MRYRRAILFAVLGKDAGPSLATLRRVAPQLEHLLVLATPATSAWPRAAPAAQAEGAFSAELQTLSACAAGVAHGFDIQLVPELPSAAVTALCADHAIDLIVLEAGSVRATSSLLLQRKHLPVAIARGFESQVDALMTASTPVRADDAAWQALAKRRAWMRHWPGMLTV